MNCVVAWWVGLSPEVQAAIIGAVASVGAAMFAVLAVIAQIRSQGRQSRDVIEETERRKIKAGLYEDAVAICRELSDATISLSTKLHMLTIELKTAATAEAAGAAYNVPTVRFPFLSSLYASFSDAALKFIFLVEDRRIIDPRILVFRSAMNAVLHDTRQLMFSDFVVHVMPVVPTDRPDGGIFPYVAPSIPVAQIAIDLSKKMIDSLDDASAYSEDFVIEMQNVLLGDLFRNHLEPRQPVDPARRAITLDRSNELEIWISETTAWGKIAAQAEADARKRFADGEANIEPS